MNRIRTKPFEYDSRGIGFNNHDRRQYELRLLRAQERQADALENMLSSNDWEKQAKNAMSVIGMIRAMIGEMFGPVIESSEATLLRGPEPKHDGEAILEALAKIKDQLNEQK